AAARCRLRQARSPPGRSRSGRIGRTRTGSPREDRHDLPVQADAQGKQPADLAADSGAGPHARGASRRSPGRHGLGDSHLHQFIIRGAYYGPQDPDDMDWDMESEDEEDILISQIAKMGRKVRFTYEYDFGDSWQHEIVLEKT